MTAPAATPASAPTPPERVPLDALAARVWQELTRAPHDRHHDWRTPVLATQGLDGLPQARTVVLRAADSAARTLTVFTDARSPKCAELQAQPAAQLVFWSPRLGWQLRVPVRAVVFTAGAPVAEAWARVGASRAAADYLAPLPPGSPWPGRGEAAADAGPGAGPDASHHLAVLRLQAGAIDWLELHRDGHRRARLDPDGALHPLVP